MKQIMIKITAFLFLATLSSCGIDMLNRIEGNNNVISINRDISKDFTKVKVSARRYSCIVRQLDRIG